MAQLEIVRGQHFEKEWARRSLRQLEKRSRLGFGKETSIWKELETQWQGEWPQPWGVGWERVSLKKMEWE
jgi:hypothetical protein